MLSRSSSSKAVGTAANGKNDSAIESEGSRPEKVTGGPDGCDTPLLKLWSAQEAHCRAVVSHLQRGPAEFMGDTSNMPVYVQLAVN